MKLRFFIFFYFVSITLCNAQINEVPKELQSIGVQEKLGQNIPLDLEFINERNERVALRSYFSKGKPVILTLVYYECPNICQFLLDGFTNSIKEFSWDLGEKFEVLTLSINPKENTDIANLKKRAILSTYGRDKAKENWHFLVGEEVNIRKLADSVGFSYSYDEEQKQYAHSSVIFVLTPDGKISRYLYGIDFNPRDLKLALLEASEGKVGNVVDRFLMYCYHYDPKDKKYSLFALNLMKLGAIATITFLVLLFLSFRRNKNM